MKKASEKKAAIEAMGKALQKKPLSKAAKKKALERIEKGILTRLAVIEIYYGEVGRLDQLAYLLFGDDQKGHDRWVGRFYRKARKANPITYKLLFNDQAVQTIADQPH